MGFVPTLLGGVIGAAAGIGVQVLVEAVAMRQAPWMAVIIGLATGLGVRMFTKAKHPGVSYLRGAIAGLIALGAVFAGQKAVAMAFTKQSNAAAAAMAKTAGGEKSDESAPAGDDKAAAAGVAAQESSMRDRPGAGGAMLDKMRRGPDNSDVWQFAFMAIGAFLAYEFARGSNSPQPAASEPEPMGGMDPSN